MQVADGQTFDEPEGVFSSLFILAGKAAQDIAANGSVGQGGTDFLYYPDKGFRGVAPVHADQHTIITALQRDMQVGHEVFIIGH